MLVNPLPGCVVVPLHSSPLWLLQRSHSLAPSPPAQCRIIRGDASNSDLAASAAANACLEEFVVLNEVVIDRGMTAQLCNLQVGAGCLRKSTPMQTLTLRKPARTLHQTSSCPCRGRDL